jgi:hypothetical protein
LKKAGGRKNNNKKRNKNKNNNKQHEMWEFSIPHTLALILCYFGYNRVSITMFRPFFFLKKKRHAKSAVHHS